MKEKKTEKRKCLDFRHHEEAKHVQKTFAQNVEDLAKAIEEMGSPFTENSNDLLVLDSRDLADPAIIDSVRKTEKLGQEQYDIYVGERSPSGSLSRRTIWHYLADLQSQKRQSRSYSLFP